MEHHSRIYTHARTRMEFVIVSLPPEKTAFVERFAPRSRNVTLREGAPKLHNLSLQVALTAAAEQIGV